MKIGNENRKLDYQCQRLNFINMFTVSENCLKAIKILGF